MGRVLLAPDVVYRFVRDGGLESWGQLDAVRRVLSAGGVQIVTGRGLTVSEIESLATTNRQFGELASQEPWAAILAHPRVPFVSYAEEWTPGMLARAAEATLDVAAALADRGWRLKDASTGNVVFDGTTPLFLDALSAEPIPAGARVWPAFAQFLQSFVFPLSASTSGRMSVRRAFADGSDGITVAEMARALGWRRWLPRYLLHVGMTHALHDRADEAWKTTTASVAGVAGPREREVLLGLLRHLRRAVRSAAPRDAASSSWTNYELQTHTGEYHARKRDLVVRWCGEANIASAIDIGANEGAVSLALAAANVRMVAVERDEAAAQRLYALAMAARAPVTPVIVDLTNPTPSRGWQLRERLAFRERAAQAFEAVVALAVLHHLVVASAAPVQEVLEELGRLATKLVIVEHVDPSDPLFQRLARGRGHLLESASRARFEEAAGRSFVIRRTEGLTPTRALYWLEHR